MWCLPLQTPASMSKAEGITKPSNMKMCEVVYTMTDVAIRSLLIFNQAHIVQWDNRRPHVLVFCYLDLCVLGCAAFLQGSGNI